MTSHLLDLARIRAITIDLDDTLWPVWPTIAQANDELLAWLQQNAPRTAALARNPEAQKTARRAVLAAHPNELHDMSLLRRESIRHLLNAAGDDTMLAGPAFDVFYDARQRVQLYDDALPTLSWLKARYPVVALSNGNADVERVGLGRYFDASVNAELVGVAKPDVRIFEAAARAAGVAPHEVLHIGDDAQLDVVGAHGAGMQTAWLNRDQALWPTKLGMPPHLVLDGLAGLRQHLGGPAPVAP